MNGRHLAILLCQHIFGDGDGDEGPPSYLPAHLVAEIRKLSRVQRNALRNKSNSDTDHPLSEEEVYRPISQTVDQMLSNIAENSGAAYYTYPPKVVELPAPPPVRDEDAKAMLRRNTKHAEEVAVVSFAIAFFEALGLDTRFLAARPALQVDYFAEIGNHFVVRNLIETFCGHFNAPFKQALKWFFAYNHVDSETTLPLLGFRETQCARNYVEQHPNPAGFRSDDEKRHTGNILGVIAFLERKLPELQQANSPFTECMLALVPFMKEFTQNRPVLSEQASREEAMQGRSLSNHPPGTSRGLPMASIMAPYTYQDSFQQQPTRTPTFTPGNLGSDVKMEPGFNPLGSPALPSAAPALQSPTLQHLHQGGFPPRQWNPQNFGGFRSYQ